MKHIVMDPVGFHRRLPLTPERMTDRLTQTTDAIVLCHLGVPHIAVEDWTVVIDGLVSAPMSLSFSDLRRFPKSEIASVHQCAGSPLQPNEPSRRVCNIRWGGARLSDVLELCRPRSGARFLWSFGADHGEFGGVTVHSYLKDLPLERITSDVLIAYEMNGAALPPVHGYPARLIVPGFYGTNSVKWLTRLTLSEQRAESPFTTIWYNDPVLDGAGIPTGATLPVWSIAPQSIITSPAAGENLCGDSLHVTGWAWSDGGVETVEVSSDGGAVWSRAELEQSNGWEWQRFDHICAMPHTGETEILARAIGCNGAMQPDVGRRNAAHRVQITVAEG